MTPAEIIRQHIPSLTDEDEEAIYGGMHAITLGVESADVADLAIRTCACGKKIDGFYDYTDHLIEVLQGVASTGEARQA